MLQSGLTKIAQEPKSISSKQGYSTREGFLASNNADFYNLGLFQKTEI